MPRRDATGPIGMGPGTGRGFGPCGLGLGWRRRYSPRRGLGRYFDWEWPQTKEDQLKALAEYRRALEEELEDVKKEEEQVQVKEK
jgi:hypothetical protein